jgi:hypothetical protein
MLRTCFSTAPSVMNSREWEVSLPVAAVLLTVLPN